MKQNKHNKQKHTHTIKQKPKKAIDKSQNRILLLFWEDPYDSHTHIYILHFYFWNENILYSYIYIKDSSHPRERVYKTVFLVLMTVQIR